MVPMTHRIDEKTQNREYFGAINKIAEEEMKKINEAMTKQAQQRKQRADQAPPTRGAQAPARARGVRGARGGSLSSRGPYHHPNEEYNV
jgi:hypothetical protein